MALPSARSGSHLEPLLRVTPRSLLMAGVALVLGVFIAVQWQAGVALAPETTDPTRDLMDGTIAQLESEQRDLKQRVSSLREQLAALQQEAKRTSGLAEIATSLEVQRLQAGLVPVEGPGVRVELDDSAREVPSDVDPNLLIVHDYEIRDVVNLLWAAGAEAIAVSGERVAANTAIYCVGSTILVNDTRLSPPYVIEAIGPPDKLYGAVTQASSLVKLKEVVERYGVQLKVSRVDALRLPAYTGEIRAQYAVPSSSMR
ncbi:MAG TPA: DUF881 domain-containing protein [Chloroflexota bacterium]